MADRRALVWVTLSFALGSTLMGAGWLKSHSSLAELGQAYLLINNADQPQVVLDDKRRVPESFGFYPKKGVMQRDATTSLPTYRFADAADLIDGPNGRHGKLSLIVYSRYTPANVTGEYVLVHGENSTSAWIYRVADGRQITPLQFRPDMVDSPLLGEVNELRWDYSGAHPYRLYFIGRYLSNERAQRGETVQASFYYVDLDPKTGQLGMPVLVRDFSKDFPQFAHGVILNDVEGDSSNDSRYWAWMMINGAQGYLPYVVFVYDRQQDKIIGSIQRSCAGSQVPCVAVDTPATARPYLSKPNMVEMSPLSTRVIVHWGRAHREERAADIGMVADGPKAFLPNFKDPILIGNNATHSGWAWGRNGEELYISQNDANDWIEAVDIASARTANCKPIGKGYSCGVKVLHYGVLDGGTWSVGMHFGKVYNRSLRGWVFINTYDKQAGHWAKNHNLLAAIPVESGAAAPIVRMSSSSNVYYDYRSEGSGALDFKGENIWATANWGYRDGRGDVLRVQLPQGWMQALP